MPTIGAIIGALLGAAFGGFLRDKLTERYFQPVLDITGGDIFPVGPYVVYHRILIKNKGKRAAKNCIGKITLENAMKDDIFKETLTAVVSVGEPQPILTKDSLTNIKGMSVCWASIGNPESLTINRDDTQLIDLYRICKTEGRLRLDLPTEKGWKPNFRVMLDGGKEYSGEILITSSNAPPKIAKFKLIPKDVDVELHLEQEL
jgi:hypothetical protein